MSDKTAIIMFWICLLILIILCVGDPDLIDVLVVRLMR
jgi:hypothetical protein